MDSRVGTAKHTIEPCDSRALVTQLQILELNDEDDVLEQILTSAEPEALSHLSAARSSKSKIPLVTARDERDFFILAGSPAYCDWNGQYPMEFSPTTKCPRKLSDPTLADEKITAYQNDALKEILTAVCATDDAVEFRKPVQVLRPTIWDNYKALIAEPIDLETMQHILYHNRYATMWAFRRHVDLLEENARKYNGDRNASIVLAATKIRSDIYRRMDEIPAESPLGHHGVSMVRRVIYADDSSTATSRVGASRDGANGSKAGTRHIGNPTFVLPLGRLGVARKVGDKEVITTPYIVVMEVESSYKALWLFKDDYTPVGLPSDKKALLEFGGQYNFTIAKLAGDIDEWKSIAGRGCRGSKRNVPILKWGKVKDLIRKTSQNEPVLFDVVEDQQQAKAAIKDARGEPPELSETENVNSFVVGDEFPDDGELNYIDPAPALHKNSSRSRRALRSEKRLISDSDDTSDESEASDVVQPRRKRMRLANRARWSL